MTTEMIAPPHIYARSQGSGSAVTIRPPKAKPPGSADSDEASTPSHEDGRNSTPTPGELESLVLSRDINECSDHGKNVINGVFKRLHPQGSHLGLSDEEDCTFRLAPGVFDRTAASPSLGRKSR